MVFIQSASAVARAKHPLISQRAGAAPLSRWRRTRLQIQGPLEDGRVVWRQGPPAGDEAESLSAMAWAGHLAVESLTTGQAGRWPDASKPSCMYILAMQLLPFAVLAQWGLGKACAWLVGCPSRSVQDHMKVSHFSTQRVACSCQAWLAWSIYVLCHPGLPQVNTCKAWRGFFGLCHCM